MRKTKREQIIERIEKLESYVYSNEDSEALIKIHKDHLEYLRNELKNLEV